MPSILDQIDIIVIVMMENRSFDHLLGYLSLPTSDPRPKPLKLDGLRNDPAWLKQNANPGLPPDSFMYEQVLLHELNIIDSPHERPDVAAQLGPIQPGGLYPMKGFVQNAKGDSNVMGYYNSDVVPIHDFFARNFCVCDRWFAALPAGTQPNRLMAMAGETKIDMNVSDPLNFPKQPLVYDWLSQRGVPWRVYHQGFFPFFSIMLDWAPEMVASDRFRRFDQLSVDFKLEPDKTFPKVIFVEPKYTDAPHTGEGSDDHRPSSVLGGQHFLLDIYRALVSNKSRWLRTAMIITYDEHGGFYDHVQPLPIVTTAPNHEYPDFVSSGPRVPGLVISPFASAAHVHSDPLDHTSILKFLAQKFGGNSYSPAVDNRKGVGSVLDTLDLTAPRQGIPPPPADSVIPTANPYVRGFRTQTEDVQAFQQVANQVTRNPELAHKLAVKFPEHRDFLGL
jgi:phospholipase C